MNTEVKERPILFSTPMVKAILEGRKTQTRRAIKPKPDNGPDDWENATNLECGFYSPTIYDRDGTAQPADEQVFGAYNCEGEAWKCPYGKVGDRLWVRERFSLACVGSPDRDTGFPDVSPLYPYKDKIPKEHYDGLEIGYYADFATPEDAGDGYWPSIFMPRWASRITLENTGIRVERVQDIVNVKPINGVEPEGGSFMPPYHVGVFGYNIYTTFMMYWDSINAKRGYSWESNPWVWVIDFKRLTQ